MKHSHPSKPLPLLLELDCFFLHQGSRHIFGIALETGPVFVEFFVQVLVARVDGQTLDVHQVCANFERRTARERQPRCGICMRRRRRGRYGGVEKVSVANLGALGQLRRGSDERRQTHPEGRTEDERDCHPERDVPCEVHLQPRRGTPHALYCDHGRDACAVYAGFAVGSGGESISMNSGGSESVAVFARRARRPMGCAVSFYFRVDGVRRD